MVTIYENQVDFKEDGAQSDIFQDIHTSENRVDLKKNDSNLSPYIEDFLNSFEKKVSEIRSKMGPTVVVSEVLGSLARVYERIRTVVEYKGEHVLRRSAIERILKRLVWEHESLRSNINEVKVAETLVKELIWARYLANNSVPKEKIEEISEVLTKYLYFLRNLDNIPEGASPSRVRNWIWGIASSEIEETLDPSYRQLYVKLMYDWFVGHFKWIDEELDEHQKEIQIYLAIHRAYTKSDEAIMRYYLLLAEVPDWQRASRGDINKFILNFPKIYSEIENHLNYKSRLVLYRRIQRHSGAFEIFREIAKREKMDLRKLLLNHKKFEETVRSVCEEKYKQIGKKINTGIIRSIVYIFITKVFFAMLIEIPYEIFVYDQVRYFPLAINVIFPPIMMWVIGMSIRIPGAKNTESIIGRLHTAVYKSKAGATQGFTVASSARSSTLNNIFGVVYLILFALVFGGISYILTLLNFSLFGILIFFVFLSLVILFAFRLRFNSTQLKVDPAEETFFGHLTSYLSLPFLNIGIYLSGALSSLNFFTIILDFIIEAPLKSMLEIFEEWTSFLREKKEEVIEMPE